MKNSKTNVMNILNQNSRIKRPKASFGYKWKMKRTLTYLQTNNY